MAADDPTQREIPVAAVWVGVDELPVEAVNQLVAQVSGPNEIVLTLGHLTPPVILGTDEQRRAQIKQLTY